jgi:hypothetical protein
MSQSNQKLTGAHVDAALDVMHEHIKALNSRDSEAIAATLHFPHYRLTGGRLKTWQTYHDYLDDFQQRAGTEWGYSEWGELNVIHADETKVHIDVRVDRFRSDGSLLTSFRSIWVVSQINGVWAAQLRSSFGK